GRGAAQRAACTAAGCAAGAAQRPGADRRVGSREDVMARSTARDRTPQRRTDAAARRRKPRSAARGGTVLGFMIGLVIGLAIAVVVALFVTRAPVPFVNKAGRAPDRVLEPRTPADAPDPNAPL